MTLAPLAYAALQAVQHDPLSAAKQSGRPIVLYVGNNIPVELIHACGCFPLQLPTAPRADYSRADRYLEPGFEPMVRTALEQLLAGELACASLLVLPRTSDAWQRLYYYLCELTRSFGEHLPEPFLYDLQQLPTDSSAQYNAQSTQLLADKLQALSNTPLRDATLSESIALYNRVREKLRRVLARRHQLPCQLPGADALTLHTLAQRTDPHALERVLDTLVTASSELATGTRTLLVGSAHDTPRLHELIARAGGQVVSDFHARGDWSLSGAIPETATPLRALSEHYHRHTLSARSYPLPLSALLDAAISSKAEVAVFFYYTEEEALTWDYPAQAAALRAQAIPSLLLECQPYPPPPELETLLKAFFKRHAETMP
jgi:benzoyl-CoA reductase/2-hydroxyglutaryl-CoA dehydratase subunit BcrC/BadD/HgdB